jgi:DnaJ-class molecular chaperone
MANYEIKPSAPKTSAPQPPRPSNFSTWKCPFCKGTGLNPYGKTGADRCPACRGRMSWEADTVMANLSTCGRCAGTGRINYMGNWDACVNCKGSGKI